MSVDWLDFANPFSSATVVVSEDYIDTFQHPQGLIAYLARLCGQLEVDIVSLERPVVVKGSWKTILKVDALLKKLISTLHGAISAGESPTDGDFNAAFPDFEGASFRHEPLKHSQKAKKNEHKSISHELSETKVCDLIEEIKINDENTGSSSLNSWYFFSNTRNRTVDTRSKIYTLSEKVPPEPYIVVEPNEISKTKPENLAEVEKVLCQVYKKETIEKYQRQSCESEPPASSGDVRHVEEDKAYSEMKKTRRYSRVVVKPMDQVRKTGSLAECGHSDSRAVAESGQSKSLRALGESRHSNSRALSESGQSNSLRILRKKETVNEECTQDVNTESACEKRRTCRKSVRAMSESVIKKQSKTQMDCQASRRKRKCKARRGNKGTKKGSPITRMEKKVKSRRKTSEIRSDRREQSQEGSLAVMECIDTEAIVEQTEAGQTESSHTEKMIQEVDQNMITNGFKQGEVTINESIHTDNSSQEAITRNHLIKKAPASVNKNKKQTRGKQEFLCVSYGCDQCSYSATKKIQLREHQRKVHLPEKFTCRECQKEFRSQKYLWRHMKCHSEAEHCCDICGKMYKDVRKLNEHKRIHSDDYVKPAFPCKFCTKSFSTKYVLAYHMKSDHLGMKRSFVCPTCGKSFSQKNSYLQHANVHLGIKPFTCEICGKTFSYEKSLREHRFMHNDEKVFSCSMCSKTFRQATGLNIHLKVHKATKDYVCSMCGKGFSQKQALVRHERIHGGEKPYECGLCKRSFADSSVLRRHMILIHKRDPKQWRLDTVCHIPRRTDFFINVINGDKSSANNVANQKNGDTDIQDIYQKQQQDHKEQQKAEKHEVLLERKRLQLHSESARSLVGIGHTETSSLVEMEHIKTSPLVGIGHTETSSLVEIGHIETLPLVSKKSLIIGKKELPVEVTTSSYVDVSYTEMKPYDEYGPETAMMPDNIITTSAAAPNSHGEPITSSSSSVHFSSSGFQQINIPVAESSHSMKPVPRQHLLPLHLQPSNATSFLPLSYQQKLINYDSPELQHMQYPAMMAQQPYNQHIVVLQDNRGTVAYYQPGLNMSSTGDSTDQSPHHRQVSPAVPASLSSSPLANPLDASHSIAAATLRQAYSRTLPTTQHDPQ